ncbi:MAG: hypothetical protein FGF48_09305 [Candidatus Brockarchaeota archaeon]|nr:hypothetical protein [Candidatus Brockarchaeota archaeon]
MAIVEVKTTSISKYYQDCLYEAKGKLEDYFTKGEWKHLRRAKFGIPVVICLEDLDKIIETEFKEGVKCNLDDIEETIKNIKWNPNYEP